MSKTHENGNSGSHQGASREKPRFKISLVEKKSPHILERLPRYDVCVNGIPKGELYFNMRGYVGYLPTVQGAMLDIGEKGISAFRREVSLLNREAADAIYHGTSDARRIALTWPTEDGRTRFALSRDVLSGTDEIHLISRRELLQAERIFGSSDVGIGFFSEHGFDPESAPVVLFERGDEALAAGLSQVRSRIMDPVEAETHVRDIEHVFDTADDQIKLVVSRRVIDDFDAEPDYVSRISLDMARARYGDAMRLSDLDIVETRPAIVDPAARSLLMEQFTWFDLDGSPAEDGEDLQP
jgi:hypothetical protein